MYIFIHSSTDGHLGCLHALTIVNSPSAAMNIGVHVPFQIVVLSGYMPRSGIAESYDNPVFKKTLYLKIPPPSSPTHKCLVKMQACSPYVWLTGPLQPTLPSLLPHTASSKEMGPILLKAADMSDLSYYFPMSK